MKKSLTKSARAKVNLWLRVLGRREDGFHEIETRMVEIGLADELHLETRDEPGVELRCSEPDLPVGGPNRLGTRGKIKLIYNRPAVRYASGLHEGQGEGLP